MPRGVPRIPRPEEYILTSRCTRCSETKAWAEFSPRVYDDEGRVTAVTTACRMCLNAAARELCRAEQSHRPTPAPREGRVPESWEWRRQKLCTRCGETKPWALFAARRYWPDGTVRWVVSFCRECKREIARAYVRGPASPERLERVRENHRRRRAVLRAERLSNVGPRLPVEPFREWLAKVLAEHESLTAVAEIVGLDEKTLRRAVTGEHQNVSLRVADQCFTRTGYHLNDFYPEIEEKAA